MLYDVLLIVGLAIAALCLLILALLLVPVQLRIEVGGDTRHALVVWGFGLLRRDLLASRPASAGARKARPAKARARRRRASTGRLRALLASEGLLRRIGAVVRRLARATHPQDVRVDVSVGCEDPADTGQLYLALAPLAQLLGRVEAASVSIEPDFVGPSWVVKAKGRFTLIPAEVALILLAFVLSPSVLRALRAARRA